MKTEIRDLWSYWGQADAVCITTNGFVKNSGLAIMGAGNAKQAKDRFPGVERNYGSLLKREGHKVQVIPGTQTNLLDAVQTALVAFPTKPVMWRIRNTTDLSHVLPAYRHQFNIGHEVPGWMCFSSRRLIEASAGQLFRLACEQNWQSIILPCPGVGNGGLHMSEVMPILEAYLDDRFTMVYR